MGKTERRVLRLLIVELAAKSKLSEAIANDLLTMLDDSDTDPSLETLKKPAPVAPAESLAEKVGRVALDACLDPDACTALEYRDAGRAVLSMPELQPQPLTDEEARELGTLSVSAYFQCKGSIAKSQIAAGRAAEQYFAERAKRWGGE